MAPVALPADSLTKMDSRKSKLKLALIALSISLTGLVAVYRQVYPLTITGGKGYLVQIPPVFWVLLVVTLAALFFIAILTRSSLVTLGVIVATALVLNFKYFLIYGVNGRDMRGEVSRLFFSLDKTHLGIDLYSYFQWPVHFLVVQQVDRVVALRLVDMIWTGYVAYYVLFAVGIGFFAYSYTSRENFPWVATAIFYIVFTRQWLNNQFVPQFIALIVLLYLFAIHDVTDTRLKILRGVLYVALVLAHPFFFCFYVSYVVGLPIMRAVIDTLDEVGTPDRSLFYQTLEAVRYTPWTLLTFQYKLRQNIGISFFNYLSFLAIAYLSFFLVRFSIFNERLFTLLSAPLRQGSSRELPARLAELVFGTGQFGDVATETTRETFLFDLVPTVLKDITLYGTIAVVLGMFLVSALALASKSSSKVSPSSIAIALAGVVYYVFGLFLPIIGNRAFQVILLPLGTSLDDHRRHRKLLMVVVLVILVASPVVVANFMTNYTLKGGGNAHDFHGDEAGRFLLEYSNLERDGAVAYHAAGFPPYITKTGEELPITTVEEIAVNEANSSDTIVYGDWQEYQARRYRYTCNFDPARRNSIYDNRLQVLEDSTISEPFACTELEQ